MRRMTPRRGGFTLVELLVVISIMATLAAIGVAAFLLTRKNEQVRATEATLEKLNTGLDAAWKATLDNAESDAKMGRIDALVTWAGGDKDRAKAIWTYLKLKNEFPTSIEEAGNPVVLLDPYTGTQVVGPSGLLQLAPKAVFRASLKVPAGTLVKATTNGQAADESAALFQWALSNTANRGMAFGQDGTVNQTGEIDPAIPFLYGSPTPATPSTLSARAFKDAYGKPIAFVRLGYSAEINNAPYAKAGAPKELVPGSRVFVVPNDPFDPLGKLPTIVPAWTGAGPQPPWDLGKLKAFWAAAASGHIGYQWQPPGSAGAQTFPRGATFGSVSDIYPFAVDTTTQPGNTLLKPFNVVPTVVAAGEDKTFAPDLSTGDDLMGFRLRREGNRGN